MIYIISCFGQKNRVQIIQKYIIRYNVSCFLFLAGLSDNRFMHKFVLVAPGDGPGKRLMHESVLLAPGNGPGKRFTHEFVTIPGGRQAFFFTLTIRNPVNLQWQYQAVGSAMPQGN